MCPHRVEPVVSCQSTILVKKRKQRETRLRAIDHRQRDRPVERNHRIGRQPFENPVQGQNLPPIRFVCGRRFVVHRRDRRLNLIWTEGCGRQRFADLALVEANFGRNWDPREPATFDVTCCEGALPPVRDCTPFIPAN